MVKSSPTLDDKFDLNDGHQLLTGSQAIVRLVMMQQARDKQVPVVVDPKGTDFGKYRGATLLTPNLVEFEAVVGHSASEEELVNKGLQLVKDLDLEAESFDKTYKISSKLKVHNQLL